MAALKMHWVPCNLYDLPLTKELCKGLEDIARASLIAKYGRGPYIQPIIGNDWPAGSIKHLKQEWDRENLKSTPKIAVMIETARIADEKVRMEMASRKSVAHKPPRRFAVGASVTVGWGRVHGVVTQMDDHVGSMGEYWHTVKTPHGEDRRAGSELELITEPRTNARNFPQNRAPTYIQNISQHGVGNSVSQLGDTHTNVLQISDMSGLKQELATIRARLKAEPDSLEADEVLGSLASAEKAVQSNDEHGVKHALSTISKSGWEIVKKVAPTVGSQMLLHYLKLHGME